MADIIGMLIPFFGLIAVGYCAALYFRQPVEALGWLNIYVIYAAMPALLFKLMSRAPFADIARFDFILLDVLGTYLAFTLIFAVARLWRRKTTPEATMQAFAGSYGNIGFMGPGLSLLAFGERAAIPVALIVCFENATHFTVIPSLMAFAKGDRRSVIQLGVDIGRKVLSHPFVLGALTGLAAALLEWNQPRSLAQFVNALASSAAPVALFSIGVTLALKPMTRVPGDILAIVPVKLVLQPLAVYAVLTLFGNFDPVWVHTAVLVAALPTAASVQVMGQHYGVWQEKASVTILVTTACSVFTLSAFLYAIRAGWL